VSSESNIKSMKLYHQVERVFNELKALGYAETDPVPVAVLAQFDQYHYLGTGAVDEAIDRLGLNAAMRVVEIGGGIGGPARHLAQASGCHVTAVELQADLNATAQQLTSRSAMSDRVSHVCGNVLDWTPSEQFDALVSWLTFLHIPDRPALYRQCYRALKPGAGMYVEDYFARGSFTQQEQRTLAEEVYCEYAPTLADYERDLGVAGFERITLIDVSDQWAKFVAERYAVFAAARERNISLHGAAVVAGLDQFYAAVDALFSGGNLGGLRLLVRKPVDE
jgi:cyclopropane fatty-acyl-phospholipid synthase-like methyltransferase